MDRLNKPSIHTHVNTQSSAQDNPLPTSPSEGQNEASVDLNRAPTLPGASQGSRRWEQNPVAAQIFRQLREEARMENLTGELAKVKTILEGLMDNSICGEIILISKTDLDYLVKALFFKSEKSSTACLIQQIYTDKNLSELRQLVEKTLDNLIFNLTIVNCKGLPSLPAGSTLDLHAILDTLCEHIDRFEAITDLSTKITNYLQLYCILSTYYEPPVLDRAFAEYSKTRIAKLEHFIGCLGSFTLNVCALFNKASIGIYAKLLNYGKDSPLHVRKIKQDMACWLMTSFPVNEGKNQLLNLNFIRDAFQKSNLKNSFHQQGTDFDKEFSNDPLFVAYILRAASRLMEEHKDTLNCPDTTKTRVHLLQTLERLGLKPENINKYHPILELALELKDPELLRYLILEYKFNPYYISDTTGYSVWQISTQQNTNYTDEFQREAASILKRFEIKYYTVQDSYHQLNAEVKEIAINKKIPQTFNINQQNQWGETPLIHAAKFGYDAKQLFAFKELDLDAKQLFAFKELDLAIKDETGKTALDYAKENNNKALVKHIEEHKRALTTIRLIDSLAANGAKDNYQGLIGFLHKKGNDGLSVIEKAYQAQNFLLIEAIECYLVFITGWFSEYAATSAGLGVQPLDINSVLEYLKQSVAKDPANEDGKISNYLIYYYSMHANIEEPKADLNQAIHEIIGLISDVSYLGHFIMIVLEMLRSIFDILSKIEKRNWPDNSIKNRIVRAKRKAHANIAHFLLLPVHIKNKTNVFIIDWLILAAKTPNTQERIKKYNFHDDFFSKVDFMRDLLLFCKEKPSSYAANPISIIQKLKKLGLDLNIGYSTGDTLLHLAIKSEEVDLLKHLILEERLNPFVFNSKDKSSWSCAAYCRNPGAFPMAGGGYDCETGQAFHKLWEEEIEPFLMKSYLNLPQHSPKNPRIDLIAQGYIAATSENINLQNQWGETPLIFAVKYGYDIANLLTIAGINIEMKDKFKKTALIYAELNKDERSEELIRDYAKKQNKTSQIFAAVNTIYQKKVANADQPPAKKLTQRQIKKAERARLKKEEQAKKQEQAKAAHTNDKAVDTPIAQRNTQKLIPPSITITIPELLNQQADNLVYQEPAQEPSPIQKAKEKIAQADKKEDAKKQKQSLLGRVVSGAKELKATLTTAVHIVTKPSEARNTILQSAASAAQRLATSKNVSTRVETHDQSLIQYPDLLDLLDLVQTQDPKLKPTSGVKKTLKALDAALTPKSKNAGAKLSVRELEAALSWAQSGDSTALTQRGSHTNLHFEGGGLTLPGAQDDYVKFIYIKNSAHTIRTALLERLGIKRFAPSAENLNPPPTDSPPAERKDESSEEEGLYES